MFSNPKIENVRTIRMKKQSRTNHQNSSLQYADIIDDNNIETPAGTVNS